MADISPPGESIRYRVIDDVEDLEMYQHGGFHPVLPDDLLHNRYRVVDKLGYGGYSTVWLAHDSILGQYVALKVGISGSTVPQHEHEILRTLSNTGSTSVDDEKIIPTMIDQFFVKGPNGTHPCYAMGLMHGNLHDSGYCRLFPVPVARALAARLAKVVATLHSKGWAHGDIRLRNVLVKLPSSLDRLSIAEFHKSYRTSEPTPVRRMDGAPLPPNVPSHVLQAVWLGKHADKFTVEDSKALILCDFGEAFEPSKEERLGKDCHTPMPSRAPEAMFEPDQPLGYASDVWSLATAIWEVLGMKSVFSDGDTANEIVAEQFDLLGSEQVPSAWSMEWGRSDTKDSILPRRPTEERSVWPRLDEAFDDFIQKYRRRFPESVIFSDQERVAILDLMRGMFRFDPKKRLTMQEVLKSEWMIEWALPSLEQSDSKDDF